MKTFALTFVLLLCIGVMSQVLGSVLWKQSLDFLTRASFWSGVVALSLVLTPVAIYMKKHGWW